MAEHQTVWGIDIGQAGLKAIKLRYADAAKQAVAVAFDYVPHPKILSQPDAVPEELIPAALDTFLSRNSVKGDVIAISVPGQTSLAKFIKLPPVEASKVAEIVKYEARQQIPFDLDDVIWDYQPLGGGVEEGGFMLEAEVGLFAMKREQVLAQLQPFVNAGQEVELVQTSPLALYNFLSYDVLGHRVENGEPPDREEHYILLDMGADNTTLLVSNGRSIWIRNVPIGGNHFTRALTKEMKLTFAKAEHLKCNATRSPDPRAVFQALRPVFNDYVSEIQRSIGYFSSVNREAVVSKVLGVGNGFKLAGLQKFLQQNLQYEVERVDSYNGLVGDSVLNSSLFQDNIMSFTVPYGLALQGLGVTRIRTSLLPPEIAMERKIRRKKPWAIAAAAGLLGAFSLSAVGNAMVYKSVSEETFKPGHEAVATLKSAVGKNSSDYETALSKHNEIKDKGLELTGSLDRRELWLEVYKAINEALPRDLDDRQADDPDPSRKNRIRLTSITAEKVDDLADWFKGLKEADVQLSMAVGRPEDAAKAPEGAGYVFTIIGSHFRDDIKDPNNSDRGFVQTQFISNLQKWVLDRGGLEIPVRKAGISHVLLTDIVNRKVLFDPNNPSGGRYAAPAASASANLPGDSRLSAGGGGGGAGLTIGGDDSPPPTGGGAAGGSGLPFGADDFNPDRKPTRELTEYQFKVQFVWKPTKPAERPETEPPTAEVSDSAEKK